MVRDTRFKICHKILIAIFILCVFFLSLVELYSYDIWFHLSYGREVLRLGGMPEKEIFLFSIPDSYMVNNEWLFDILVYIIWVLSGPAGIVLMKALLISLLFLFIFLDANTDQRRVISSVIVLFLVSIIMRFRFIERPELFANLFLAVDIWMIHILVYKGGKRQLLVLPFLQLLWANMHPSSVMTPFIACSYLIGGVLIEWINKKTGIAITGRIKRDGAKWLLLTSLLVIVATFINPSTYHIFLIPYSLATTSLLRHAVTELQPLEILRIKSLLFWYVALWLGTSMVSLKRVNPVDFVISAIFLYMASEAKRFLPLFLITSSPMVIRNLSYIYGITHISHLQSEILRYISYAVLAILLPLLTVFTINRDHEVRFGLGFYPYRFPEGGIEYLKRNGIKANLFNTFHFGGYIEWRYFPDGKPIVDGRGPMYERLLEKVLLAEENRLIFSSLEGMFGFEAAIIENPVIKKGEGATDIPYLQIVEKEGFTPQDWALVYWDDVSLVYLKRKEKFRDIIKRDEYKFASPLMWHRSTMLSDKRAKDYVDELRRNIRGNPYAISPRVYLAMIMLNKRDISGAKQVLQEVEDKVRERYTRLRFGGPFFSLLGKCYLLEGDMDKAVNYYEEALKLSHDPAVMVSLGELYLKMGREKEGKRALEYVLKVSRRNLYAINVLKAYYTEKGDHEKLKEIDDKYKDAMRLITGEEHFIKATKLYISKRYHEAIKEFMESLKVNPASPPAWTNLGYVYFDTGAMNEAEKCFINALDIDPNWPEAHYGLGLIYERTGDKKMAVEHFGRYLRANPRGFWSKRAEERIERLEKGR